MNAARTRGAVYAALLVAVMSAPAPAPARADQTRMPHASATPASTASAPMTAEPLLPQPHGAQHGAYARDDQATGQDAHTRHAPSTGYPGHPSPAHAAAPDAGHVMPAPARAPMAAGAHGMHGQNGRAPADARSGDYSDGLRHGSMPGMDMPDDAPLAMLLVDRLEGFSGSAESGSALDAQAWYGNGANKLWLKAEGERSAGRLQDLRSELLWARPVAAYWDLQLGLRHDAGTGPSRSFAAFGVQGLAPYWFDVEATFYVGASGRTTFRASAEYELLLTQRLIVQPRLELNVEGRGDPRRRLGAGFSDVSSGLRLRYEFTRKFAPYLGVEFARRLGRTADFAREAGEPAFERRVVAGVRVWF